MAVEIEAVALIWCFGYCRYYCQYHHHHHHHHHHVAPLRTVSSADHKAQHPRPPHRRRWSPHQLHRRSDGLHLHLLGCKKTLSLNGINYLLKTTCLKNFVVSCCFVCLGDGFCWLFFTWSISSRNKKKHWNAITTARFSSRVRWEVWKTHPPGQWSKDVQGCLFKNGSNAESMQDEVLSDPDMHTLWQLHLRGYQPWILWFFICILIWCIYLYIYI